MTTVPSLDVAFPLTSDILLGDVHDVLVAAGVIWMAVDADHLEAVDVNVEGMIVRRVVDERPLLDRVEDGRGRRRVVMREGPPGIEVVEGLEARRDAGAGELVGAYRVAGEGAIALRSFS